MSLYFYNTDVTAMQEPRRYPLLIAKRIAATSGDRSFGEQFGQLVPGDTLCMYEDGEGVVAAGTVLEEWDRRTHRKAIYYPRDHEYRISVDWYLDLSRNPISIATLKETIGYIPRGAVRKVVKHREAIERLLAERLPFASVPEAHYKMTQRAEMVQQRIVRDTGLARLVKHLYRFRCQICNTRLALPAGRFYAESHHIRPLGKPHDGPDSLDNILCLCPNHHVELDYHSIPIRLDKLKLHPKHPISEEHVDYHNACAARASQA